MTLHLFATPEEQLLGSHALAEISTAQGEGKPVVVLASKSSTALRAEAELSEAGFAFGTACSALSSWVKLRWDLYGDGRKIVTPGVRLVFMTRVLERGAAPLDSGAGTVGVLSRLAQKALPWLAQLAESSENLTLGEKTAVEVCSERYARELYAANMLEACEAEVKLPALMASQVAQMPLFVLVGFENFDYATRAFIKELVEVTDVVVSCMVNENPSTLPTATSLSELASVLGNAPIEQVESCETPNRAPDLQTLLDELFNPTHAPLEPSQAIEYLEPAGPLAVSLALSNEITKLVSQGAQSIVVVSPNPATTWRELAPKLHAQGMSVRAQISMPARSSRYAASFMRFAAAVAHLDELSRIWPEAPALEDSLDMSWWPPYDIEDFLLISTNDVDVANVWSADAKWRSNRTLTPRAVLDRLQNKGATSKLVAGITSDLLKGHIAAAAGRVLRSFEPDDSQEDANDAAPEAPLGSNADEQPVSAEQLLATAQDVAALKVLTKIGAALKDATISLESADVSLSYMVSLGQNILKSSVISVGAELLRDSPVMVTIANPSIVASLAPCSADALIYTGLDSKNTSIPQAGGTLDALLEHLSIEKPTDPLDTQRARFANILRVPSRYLAFEKTIYDASAEETFPAVMLQEVFACYAFINEDDKEEYTLKSLEATRLDEGCIEENLSAQSAYPEAASITGAAPAGSLATTLQRFVIVPHDGSKEVPADGTEPSGGNEANASGVWVDGAQSGDGTHSAAGTSSADGTPSGDVTSSAAGTPSGDGAQQENIPTLSASQIESYLECPYKWFTQRRLGLKTVDTDFSPAVMGIFVHHVLEVTHRTLMFEAAHKEGLISDELLAQARTAEVPKNELFWFDPSVRLPGSRVTRDNLEHAKQILSDEFDTYLAEQFAKESGGRGLVPHTQQDYRQLAALKQDMFTTLEFECDKFIGFEPRLFEGNFGGDSKIKVRYAGADIVGTIDRIDVDSEGRALIIDYKHKSSLFDDYALVKKGSRSNMDAFELPHRVQTLMYASIANDLLSDKDNKMLKDKNIHVVGALYLSTKGTHELAGALNYRDIEAVYGPGNASDTVIARTTLPTADVSDFDDLLERTKEKITDVVQRMKAGYIETNPYNADACKWCPVHNCEKRLAECQN